MPSSADINPSQKGKKTAKIETAERLVAALGALWRELPQSEITLRNLASAAQCSVSAVDYHFGGLERLYVAAQDVALRAADRWMDEQIASAHALCGAALTPEARASLIAGVIDEWCEGQRPAALAWREAFAAASANPQAFADCRQQWAAMWLGFWRELSAICGLTPFGVTVALFADGEASQHLLRWNRRLDRAMLDETVLALIGHCAGACPPDAPVRSAYRHAAGADYETSAATPGSNPAYDDAAAALLVEAGLGALTFRAVAARANGSLGSVGHYFGTKSQLLRRALQRVYEKEAMVGEIGVGAFVPIDRDHLIAEAVRSIASGEQPVLRAFDEIILASCRNADLVPLRGAVRGFADPAAVWALRQLQSGAEPSIALSAAFSSVCRGLGHIGPALLADEREALGRTVLGSFAFDR